MRYIHLLTCFLFTIVITDPYADITYGEIDVYEYNEKSEKQSKRKRKPRKRDAYKKKKLVWCWMCDPPRLVYRK